MTAICETRAPAANFKKQHLGKTLGKKNEPLRRVCLTSNKPRISQTDSINGTALNQKKGR